MADGFITIPKILEQAAGEKTLIPFVGPGVSRHLEQPFPNWHELSLRLLRKAAPEKDEGRIRYINSMEEKTIREFLRKGRYRAAAEALRFRLPRHVYREFLVEIFNPTELKVSPEQKKNNPAIEPRGIHKAVLDLKPPLILTTNYDLLLEDAYAEQEHKTSPPYTYRATDAVKWAYAEFRSKENKCDENVRPVIFKLHGSITDPSEMIVTEIDYELLPPGFSNFLASVFNIGNVLLLGFSLSDPELISLLNKIRPELESKDTDSSDYIFLPRDELDRKNVSGFEAGSNIKLISPLLRVEDLKDPDGLAAKLRDAPDPLSQYLRGQFSQDTRQQAERYDGSVPLPAPLRDALVDGLNQLLKGSALFDEQRSAKVDLTDTTRSLIEQEPQGDDLLRLNRLLLEEAYPDEIARGDGLEDRCGIKVITYDSSAEYAAMLGLLGTLAESVRAYCPPKPPPRT